MSQAMFPCGLILVLTGALVGTLGCAPGVDEASLPSARCIGPTFRIGWGDSPRNQYLEWLRNNGEPGLPEIFVAREPSTSARPVDAMKDFTLGGRTIAWIDTAREAALVIPDAFPDGLEVASPIDGDFQRAFVGTASPALREAFAPRDLVIQLLRLEAIRTYLHVGAELCRTAESDRNGTYAASFRGTHTYVTSKTVVKPIAFRVTIDAAGRISVEHLPNVRFELPHDGGRDASDTARSRP